MSKTCEIMSHLSLLLLFIWVASVKSGFIDRKLHKVIKYLLFLSNNTHI